MTQEIEKSISEALSKGSITTTQRNIILFKARQEGLNLDEILSILDTIPIADSVESSSEVNVAKIQEQSISVPPDYSKLQKKIVSETQICPYCGTTVSTQTIACPHCGKIISASSKYDSKNKPYILEHTSTSKVPIGKIILIALELIAILTSIIIWKPYGEYLDNKDFMNGLGLMVEDSPYPAIFGWSIIIAIVSIVLRRKIYPRKKL